MNEPILLSGNSPGELWDFVRPLAFALRRRFPSREILLFLFPCNYATGKEAEIAREQLNIPRVFTPGESVRALLFGNSSLSKIPKSSLLIHLGGDVMYASLLARRFGWKTYAYQWGRKFWDRPMAGYLVSNENQKQRLLSRGIPEKKIRVVGDLMVDAVRMSDSPDQNSTLPRKGRTWVTFLPGSRFQEVKHMLPFYLRVAEMVKERFPDASFAMAVSPFLSNADVQEAIAVGKTHVLESSGGRLLEKGSETVIQTEKGAEISLHRGNSHRLMQESDLLVTIPGTKCGEAGFLGIPMLVLLPTNKLEEIPYPGVPGLLEKIPIAGKWLKRYLLSRHLPVKELLAQPNLLAKKEIVPELVGHLTPSLVADAVAELLRNEEKRKQIRRKLQEVYGSVKPAAEEILAYLFREI